MTSFKSQDYKALERKLGKGLCYNKTRERNVIIVENKAMWNE